jgi:hypothetical protein
MWRLFWPLPGLRRLAAIRLLARPYRLEPLLAETCRRLADGLLQFAIRRGIFFRMIHASGRAGRVANTARFIYSSKRVPIDKSLQGWWAFIEDAPE